MTAITTMPSAWQRFKQSDFCIIFYAIKWRWSALRYLVFLLLALLAPVIAPSNPYDLASIDIMDSELPPMWIDGGDGQFVLGTDGQGRDILSTILYGSRLSLTIGFLAVGLQLILGIIIGLSAGYFGGRIDSF